MEQLFATFGINGKLLLAQTVNFGILLVALTYFFYKPLMRSLEARQKMVTKGVDDAQRASQKLAAADDVAADKIVAAEDQAQEIMIKARDGAHTERIKIMKEAQERAAALSADAQARAKEDASKLLRESEKEIARLAILAAEKTLIHS